MFDHDLLADLPAPRGDEPPSLRADIGDELADHLRCAFRREVFKDGDETAAQQRVLDRFGDPKKLARRLWWQAMWSLIMRQRILSGMQWLVSSTAVVLAGAVLWQQSQIWQEMRTARQEEAVQRQALTTALNQLRAVYGSPAAVAEETAVEVADEKLADLRSSPGPKKRVRMDSVPEDSRVDQAPPVNATVEDEVPEEMLSSPELPAAEEAMVEVADEKSTDLRLSPVPQTLRLAGGPLVDATGEDQPDRYAFIEDESPRMEDESPPSLTVRFILERADGPTVSPKSVELVGHDGTVIKEGPSARLVYRSLQPAWYELKVTLADGQSATRQVLIRDEKPQELAVICPGPRPLATVLVTVPPLPEDLRVTDHWQYWIAPQPVFLDGVAWELPSGDRQTLSFDPKTGGALTLWQAGKSTTDLRSVKPEDRVVFMHQGPAATGFSMGLPGAFMVEYPPQGARTLLGRTVEPGENRWTIELPEEFLAQARGRWRQSRGYANPAPTYYRAEALPAASTTPPQLALKLVQDKEDGPPANVDRVMIESGKTSAERAGEEGSADNRRFVFHTLSLGYYQLTVHLKDGQQCTRQVLVRDEKPQELTVICPGPRKEVPVSITLAPLPEELRKRKFEVKVDVVAAAVEIGQSKWTASGLPSQHVTFDRATGLPTAIEMWSEGTQRHFDLSELPADERSIFLPVGTVNYSFSATEVLDGLRSVPVYSWPKGMGDAGVWLKQTIAADQKTWKLELPQAYLDEMFREDPDPLSVR